jgi:hypothetical protein
MMSEQRKVETPADRLAVGRAILALAARLSGAVRDGQITESIYLRPVRLETGGTGLRLPAYPGGTLADLYAGIDNILLLAISGSALTTDEVLQQVYGTFDPASASSMTGIRMLVYQLRNAFAHRPWEPTWNIRSAHLGVFPVLLDNGSKFDFDTRTLNGQRLKPDDFGGLEFWVMLLQHCERMIGAEGSKPPAP